MKTPDDLRVAVWLVICSLIIGMGALTMALRGISG